MNRRLNRVSKLHAAAPYFSDNTRTFVYLGGNEMRQRDASIHSL